LSWAESDKPLQGGTLGEWIYNRSLSIVQIEELPEFTNSLTQNAKQKNWKTPTEFPCCPQDIGTNPIKSYVANLKVERVFSQNQYTKSIIESFATSKVENILWIMCKCSEDGAKKPYSLAEISYQNDYFIHNSLGSFFQKDGAEKQFTLVQGLEWTRGDTFDDYC
jgi:hypothetical protein